VKKRRQGYGQNPDGGFSPRQRFLRQILYSSVTKLTFFRYFSFQENIYESPNSRKSEQSAKKNFKMNYFCLNIRLKANKLLTFSTLKT
jgi:hypothetical protein